MPTPPSDPPPRSPLAVALLVVLVAAAAGFALFVVGQNVWIDDSFISFRYARNLVAGHGLVFNVGTPVEGYTNFLWTMVTAAGLALGLDAMPFAQGAGLVAQAVTLVCLFEIARGSGQRGLRALLAPLLLATSFGFLAYPMTGMETSFFTMLLTLGFLACQRRAWERTTGGVLLGVALFALGTARFDGFGPVGLLLSYPLLFGGRERSLKRLAVPVAVFLGGMALYNAWRLWFYPTPLPTTFYAKTTFSWNRTEVGFGYLRSFALGTGLLPLALALVPFAALRAGRTARYAGWVVLGQFAYVSVVGGDWMMHHRFVMPVLPLLFLLSAEGALAIGDALAPRVPTPRALGALALLALVAFQVRGFDKDLRYEEISGPFFEPKHADRIGRYLAEHLPPDELVAIEWGGIIPLHIPNDCLDTWGLTDLDWALDGDLQKLVWGTNVGPWLLAKRAPDLIVCNCRILPTEEAARKSVLPGGPNHYRYYPQMVDEKYGYRWKFFQLGPNAWWPALVKRESEN